MASSAVPLIGKLKEQLVTINQETRKNLAKKRVVDEVSKLIMSQPIESDNESSSNLFKILVRRFKAQLARVERDPIACDVAARKLAKFVESVMKKAYFAQKSSPRSTRSVRSYSAVPGRRDSANMARSVVRTKTTQEAGLEKDSIIKGLDFINSKMNIPVVIEKVPRSIAHSIPKCGPLYSANIGGKKVYVQEVKEGESKKALISRVNSEAGSNREWSSWMVDLANKTKEWVKWLDEKASLVDKLSNTGRDSRILSSPSPTTLGTPVWTTLEDESLSRASGNEAKRSPREFARVYQNRWRESSSDSSFQSEQSSESGPPSRNHNTTEHSPRSRRSTGSPSDYRSLTETSDFYIIPKSTCSQNFTFSSSKRKPQSPPIF